MWPQNLLQWKKSICITQTSSGQECFIQLRVSVFILCIILLPDKGTYEQHGFVCDTKKNRIRWNRMENNSIMDANEQNKKKENGNQSILAKLECKRKKKLAMAASRGSVCDGVDIVMVKSKDSNRLFERAIFSHKFYTPNEFSSYQRSSIRTQVSRIVTYRCKCSRWCRDYW